MRRTSLVLAEAKCAGCPTPVDPAPDGIVGAPQAQQPTLSGAGCPFWKYSIFHGLWLSAPNLATEAAVELWLR